MLCQVSDQEKHNVRRERYSCWRQRRSPKRRALVTLTAADRRTEEAVRLRPDACAAVSVAASGRLTGIDIIYPMRYPSTSFEGEKFEDASGVYVAGDAFQDGFIKS